MRYKKIKAKLGKISFYQQLTTVECENKDCAVRVKKELQFTYKRKTLCGNCFIKANEA